MKPLQLSQVCVCVCGLGLYADVTLTIKAHRYTRKKQGLLYFIMMAPWQIHI